MKYTWKSAAYHSIRKRITERKDQPCRQYNPCSCQTACGKQCSCLLNGTCCEKYCRWAVIFKLNCIKNISSIHSSVLINFGCFEFLTTWYRFMVITHELMISWCLYMYSFYWYLLIYIDVLRVARIDLEVVIVLKVNVEAVSVHALLQTGNVIQMFVEIVGSGELWLWFSFFLLCNLVAFNGKKMDVHLHQKIF